jgi:hypothetical protein
MTGKDELKILQKQRAQGHRPDDRLLERLANLGYITVSETTNMDTPAGRREFLFIDFTDEGRRVLEARD